MGKVQTLNDCFGYIDWSSISSDLELSEEFMEKYTNQLDWNYIPCYQKLSESLILH
jgi:hypothetical protein